MHGSSAILAKASQSGILPSFREAAKLLVGARLRIDPTLINEVEQASADVSNPSRAATMYETASA